LISSLGIDEYYRMSNSSSVKDMWDTLRLPVKGPMMSNNQKSVL
jgi:hypothetical protein